MALVLAGIVAPAYAADDFPILVYPCQRAAQPPVIDGVLDEPAWQQAALVSGFTYYDKAVLAPVQTSFRVLYDDRALYFGVVCSEPAMNSLRVTHPPRDSLEIFQDECVEVFVYPQHDHQRYLHFAAGVGGSLYDAEGLGGFWQSRAEAAVHLGEEQWSLELAIPWADLGVAPQPARVLGFNVCRERYLGPTRQWTTWSRVDANFHDPARFAHLVLSASPEEIGRLADEFRKGGRTGPLRVFGAEGFSGKTYRALAEAAVADVDSLLSETRSIAADSSPEVAGEIRSRLGPLAQRAAELRDRLGADPLDASAWVAIEQESSALLRDLRALLWQARLAALLASI